jgi:hypothetical protein
MEILRRYNKLAWFDFLDRIEFDLKEKPKKDLYFELLDEICMRQLESVSEGGTYKLRAPTKSLLIKFKERMAEDSSFAGEVDFNELEKVAETILKD